MCVAVSLAMPTAPVLVAFDTNWLIHRLADTMCRVSDIAGRQKDTSVLIPKAVLTELDRLKTRGRDEATRSSVSGCCCCCCCHRPVVGSCCGVG